ncbi:hypothetical protein MRB53_038369 [Persea americana]|nr:hypothetical protein MRB53_038369 [Persea americana]
MSLGYSMAGRRHADALVMTMHLGRSSEKEEEEEERDDRRAGTRRRGGGDGTRVERESDQGPFLCLARCSTEGLLNSDRAGAPLLPVALFLSDSPSPCPTIFFLPRKARSSNQNASSAHQRRQPVCRAPTRRLFPVSARRQPLALSTETLRLSSGRAALRRQTTAGAQGTVPGARARAHSTGRPILQTSTRQRHSPLHGSVLDNANFWGSSRQMNSNDASRPTSCPAFPYDAKITLVSVFFELTGDFG